MSSLVGFGFIAFLVMSAMEILEVDRSFYFDEVAFIIVLGGTLAIAIITNPLRKFFLLFTAPLQMVKKNKRDRIGMIQLLVKASKVSKLGRSGLMQLLSESKMPPFLRDGIELLILDLERDEFKSILTERIYRERQRQEVRVSFFRKLAKYPPGLGLVGTVLGLVNLMRSVGVGGNAGEVGMKMALALIATLYGLGLSNLYFVPMSEYFQREAEEDKIFLELQLEGLLMVFDAKSDLAVQEMLNSFLPAKERQDVLGIRTQRQKAS